ncbi:MAG: hypothetical protein ACSLEW_08515 [Nocardioides sp.]
MARTIYLHIGLPKTGTTFLQTTMWENRRALRKTGFLYPGRQRMDHYRASQEVRGATRERMGAHGGAWTRLVEELKSWDGDGIITHEFFSMASASQAKAAVAALSPAKVEVLVTVRSYALQFPAVWQEALKMDSTQSFDEFMASAFDRTLKGAWGWRSQDVVKVLDRWGAAVVPEQITVVTVPPPGAPRGELWARWVQATGIDDSGFDLDLAYANESLGAPQAALLHRVKPYLSGDLTRLGAQHRWVRGYFGHEVLVPQRGPRFSPRPRDSERLVELSCQAADRIADRGLRVIGDLDDLRHQPGPTDGPNPDDITPEETVEVAARAIEQMIRDVAALTEERDRWRAEAKRARGRSLWSRFGSRRA